VTSLLETALDDELLELKCFIQPLCNIDQERRVARSVLMKLISNRVIKSFQELQSSSGNEVGWSYQCISTIGDNDVSQACNSLNLEISFQQPTISSTICVVTEGLLFDDVEDECDDIGDDAIDVSAFGVYDNQYDELFIGGSNKSTDEVVNRKFSEIQNYLKSCGEINVKFYVTRTTANEM